MVRLPVFHTDPGEHEYSVPGFVLRPEGQMRADSTRSVFFSSHRHKAVQQASVVSLRDRTRQLAL